MKRTKVLGLLTVLGLGLVFQIFLSCILWDRKGNIPPSFDDSYAYIFTIRKFLDQHTLTPLIPYLRPETNFLYIGYTALMGFLASAFDLTAFSIYQSSFIWSKLLLVVFVYYWARSFIDDKKTALISVVLLSFVGDGAIHGFFWVAPDFFAILTWLIILALSNRKVISTKVVYLISALSLAMVAFHPIGYMFGMIYVLWTYFNVKSGSKDAKSGIYSTIAILGGLVSLSLIKLIYLTLFTSTLPTWGPSTALLPLNVRQESLNYGEILVRNFKMLWSELIYFFAIFPPIIFVLWKSVLLVKSKIPTLWHLIFSSTFVVFMVTILIQDGFRSLYWLWILIYSICAYGIVTSRFNWKLIVIIVFLSIHIAWNLMGLWQGRNYNDHSWQTECVEFVADKTMPYERIYFTSQSGINSFAAYGLGNSRKLYPSFLSKQEPSEYYLVFENYEFEGNSDVDFNGSEKINAQITILDKKDCGYFTVSRVLNKID